MMLLVRTLEADSEEHKKRILLLFASYIEQASGRQTHALPCADLAASSQEAHILLLFDSCIEQVSDSSRAPHVV